MTGAEILYDLLKAHDVKQVFGYPGGAILPVSICTSLQTNYDDSSDIYLFFFLSLSLLCFFFLLPITLLHVSIHCNPNSCNKYTVPIIYRSLMPFTTRMILISYYLDTNKVVDIWRKDTLVSRVNQAS